MNGSLSIVTANRGFEAPLWRQIADLHKREIHEGFLSTLDGGFLANLYSNVASCDEGFIIAAVDERGAVAGFICGTTDASRVLRKCVMRSGLRLLAPLLPRLLSWRTAARLFETVRYASRDSTSLPKAEILNFCVDRSVQGKGIGRQLFENLIEEFKRRGVSRIRIVTGASQESAQRFYRLAGASHIGDLELHRGTQSIVFVYDIH